MKKLKSRFTAIATSFMLGFGLLASNGLGTPVNEVKAANTISVSYTGGTSIADLLA